MKNILASIQIALMIICAVIIINWLIELFINFFGFDVPMKYIFAALLILLLFVSLFKHLNIWKQ